MKGIIQGREIEGKTLTELKRKASIVANNNYNVMDSLTVLTENGNTLLLHRFNKKCPNNTIIRAKWK